MYVESPLPLNKFEDSVVVRRRPDNNNNDIFRSICTLPTYVNLYRYFRETLSILLPAKFLCPYLRQGIPGTLPLKWRLVFRNAGVTGVLMVKQA